MSSLSSSFSLKMLSSERKEEEEEEEHSFFYFDELRASSSSRVRTNPNSAVVQGDTFRWMLIACVWGFSVRIPGNQYLAMDFLFASAKGALLAAHDFNTRNSVIVPRLSSLDCNLKLELDFFDTYQDARNGAMVVQKYIASLRKYAAVLGALRSAVSVPMAVLNRVHGIPQISHTSTSTVLNERATYSLFGRVIPSTDGDARAAIQYMKQRMNTTHLGVLYVSEEYSIDYHRSLQQAAVRSGITVKSFAVHQDVKREDWLDRLGIVLDQLMETEYRHFIGVIFQEQLKDLINLGAAKGLFGAGRFWMFGDTITGNTLLSLKYPPHSPQAQALQGLALLSAGTLSIGGTYERFVEHYDSFNDKPDFLQYFESKSPVSDFVHFTANYTFGSPDHYTLLAYDAVMSIGFAACQSPKAFVTGSELFDQFLDTNFQGASGWVQINPETASREFSSMAYILRNVQTFNTSSDNDVQIKIVRAAEYASPTTNTDNNPNTTVRAPAEWLDVNGGFNFSDGTTIPPLSLPMLTQHDRSEFSTALYTIFVIVGVLLVLCSVGLAIWMWYCCNSRVVKASQPGFLLLICVGGFFMACSILMRGATYPPHSLEWANFGCQAQYWFFCFGFSLAFSALFAKTWRILQILGEHVQRFHRVVVKPRDVLVPVFFFVAGNLLILTVWQIVDPLHFVRRIDTEGSVDRFGRYTETIAECASEHGKSKYFMAALLILNGCMIVAANIMAYRARHIRMEFSESNYVGLAMAIILQALILSVPVFVVETTQMVSLVATQILVTITDSAILFLLFVPKISAWQQAVKRAREKLELQKTLRARSLAVASTALNTTSTHVESAFDAHLVQLPRSSHEEEEASEHGLLVVSVCGFELKSSNHNHDQLNEPITFHALSRAISQRTLSHETLSRTSLQSSASEPRLDTQLGRYARAVGLSDVLEGESEEWHSHRPCEKSTSFLDEPPLPLQHIKREVLLQNGHQDGPTQEQEENLVLQKEDCPERNQSTDLPKQESEELADQLSPVDFVEERKDAEKL